MSYLAGKRVLLAVGGGIAAYKSAELTRLLGRAGAEVQVAMTAAARRFVTELTFQALSGRRVATDLFDLGQESEIGHVAMAERADLFLVAPATADLIARLAAGMGDDVVTTMALVARCPLLLAPAMNANMWTHPLTQANLERLRGLGRVHEVGPDAGDLACGWVGPGRMAEPPRILDAAERLLAPHDLAGLRVVVSAGPTHEAIDPVRYLGNRSSGKMGWALAAEAARRGAAVRLVAGPTALAPPAGVATERVESAREMQAAVTAAAAGADVVVMCAAVADFRPAAPSAGKVKRAAAAAGMTLELVPNPDILAELGARRRAGGTDRPLLVGFAAEVGDVEAEARRKLADKGADLIVANDVAAPGSGFGGDTNRVALVDEAGIEQLPLAAKGEVAARVWDRIAARLGRRA